MRKCLRTIPEDVEEVWVHGQCPDGMGAATCARLYELAMRQEPLPELPTRGDEPRFKVAQPWDIATPAKKPKLPPKPTWTPIRFIYLKHSQPVPSAAGKRVAVFDFSFDEATTIRLLGEAASLCIYDHHIGAKEVMDKFSDNCTFDNDHSGAYLASTFFFPDTPVAWWVLLIQDRDLWRFILPETKAFREALANYYDATPDAWLHAFYPSMFKNDTSNEITAHARVAFSSKNQIPYINVTFGLSENEQKEFLARGQILLPFVNKMVANKVRYILRGRFCGLWTGIVNCTELVSETCHEMLLKHENIQLALAWRMDHYNGKIECSIRSRQTPTDVDCTKIAQRFNGNGHANAAGFKLDGYDTNILVFLEKNQQ